MWEDDDDDFESVLDREDDDSWDLVCTWFSLTNNRQDYIYIEGLSR